MLNALKKLFFINAHYLVLFGLFGASVLPLAGAYISQYVFGMNPCVLCLYQRIPYWIIFALTLFFLVLGRRIPLLFILISNGLRRVRLSITSMLLIISMLAFFTVAGIAAFHVGVEQGWWKGAEKCSGEDFSGTLEELRARIAQAPLARCDQPEFYFLGLTMAAWNLLYAFLMGWLCFAAIRTLRKVR